MIIPIVYDEIKANKTTKNGLIYSKDAMKFVSQVYNKKEPEEKFKFFNGSVELESIKITKGRFSFNMNVIDPAIQSKMLMKKYDLEVVIGFQDIDFKDQVTEKVEPFLYELTLHEG